MGFLSPLFLIGALAAAVPLVLHLLKREPEARLRFSAVKLLRRAPVEHTRRRHLNEILLLLLRVAALLLLALAFARPFLAAGTASSSAVTVIALDTSLSLSAPGQFEKARERAVEAIATADSGLVAVVTFADSAQVAARPSGDRALARAAIDAASPGFGATRYRAALNAAAELLDGGSGAIVVVTDLQGSGWAEGDQAMVPDSARVEVIDVGAPPPNLAVVDAHASSDRIVAMVRNAAAEPRDARVRLMVDGRPAGEATAQIGGHQSAEVVLAGARGREAVVTVDDPAGVQGDNSWHAVLDNAGRPVVLVVTANGDLERDAFYLRHAIGASNGDGAAYDVEGVSAAQLSSWDRARLDRYAAVAVVSTRGLESRGRELIAGYIRDGGGALVAAGPDVDADVAAGAVGGAATLTPPSRTGGERDRSLAPADLRHPIFEAFSSRSATLGLVTFRRVAAIAGDGCQALARFTTGDAALVECAVGEGRVLVFASDLDNGWNDFPLHATFVPFVHETIRYLSAARSRPGDYLIADVPAGVPPTPGFATITGEGTAPVSRIAVNVDPAESDPGRLTAEEFQAEITRMKDVSRAEAQGDARQREDRQHVWRYILGLMVAVLVLECVVGARTS
jgi:hypothetical protein